MGNAITGARTCKVMKVDGTTFRIKPPSTAGQILANHPGHDLFDSSDVKRRGIRASPLSHSHPLKSGKIYFLVELPRIPDGRVPRRAWSGNLNLTARDRLENLKLSRRSVSDLSIRHMGKLPLPPVAEATVVNTVPEIRNEGPMQLRVKLPRAQVAKLVEESFDAADAAAKIVELFLAREEAAAAPPQISRQKRKEKKTRFMVMQDQIVM